MKQWEYMKIEWLQDNYPTQLFEVYGRQGWELTDTVEIYSFGNPIKFVSIFKREKPEQVAVKQTFERDYDCPLCEGYKQFIVGNQVSYSRVKICPRCNGTGRVRFL